VARDLFRFIGVLFLAFNVFVLFAQAPLKIKALSNDAEYPPGTKIAGIEWRQKFSELRITIANLTNYDYQDIDLVMRPDEPVVAIGQDSHLLNVYFDDALPITPNAFRRAILW
jgi:hypothetical protein